MKPVPLAIPEMHRWAIGHRLDYAGRLIRATVMLGALVAAPLGVVATASGATVPVANSAFSGHHK